MSNNTKKALLSSLKDTFALGIQEFSRTLTGALPKQTGPNSLSADDAKIHYDQNQISKGLDHRETTIQ